MVDGAPEKLSDFVGQARASTILSVMIRASLKMKRPVPHCLLAGPAGVGKTTLARIIASERSAAIVETVAPSLSKPCQIVSILKSLPENAVLFLDEAHGLSNQLSEILFTAMDTLTIEDNNDEQNQMLKSLGISSAGSKKKISIKPFTLIACTTEHLSGPFSSRLQRIQLNPYSLADLTKIVMQRSRSISFPINKSFSEEIAKRSKSSARIAISNLKWLQQFQMACGKKLSKKMLHDAFTAIGTDENGMDQLDRRLLEILCSATGPMGIGTIASQLDESVDTVAHAIEPWHLKVGNIEKTPRGRVVTEKGRALVLQEVAA